MSAIPFDTHEFYVELVQSGLPEKTATALTKAVTQIEQAKLDDLVTKGDLRELELKLSMQIEKSRADVTTLIVRLGFLQTGLITAVLLKLAGTF
ncbi:MAG: hypothetical protein PHN45_04345 [Methylococcales bacterium]|nr:hypothetical protein [Methylococcales bacterium]MDD5753965.1 hypothetical protein [Methylococcales bacterium]